MQSESIDVLEFQALKEILVRFADSPGGVRLLEQLKPLTDISEIQRQLDLTHECLDLIESGQDLRFSDLVDYNPVFEKLHIAGKALEAKEILQVLQLVVCTKSTKGVLGDLSGGCRYLTQIERQLPSLTHLWSSLSGKFNEAGEVEDHASPALKKIRHQLNVVRERLVRSLGGILRKHDETQVLQDDVITIRNDRFVIPVRIEKRKELAGVVHGTSSSGSTIFVEPLEAIELNNQIVRLREQAEEEIRRILLLLTDEVRSSLVEIERASGLLGDLDSAFSRARFTRKFGCTFPTVNEEGSLEIVDGRHPVLERNLLGQNREIVPISVSLNRTSHILVISGPNTGGKTIALKTVGLLTTMALSGIPLPAVSANICVFSQILADIGDRQSIAENLSTFSSHLVNIREILEKVKSPALVLLDELGTGTDPAEGSALGVAIVEELRQRGITAVVTTHHNGLKMYASRTPQVSNASVEFDEASLRPTYRLLHGIPGSSSGLEIARRLGLEEQLLEHARGLISEEEKEIGSYSRQLRQQIEALGHENKKLESARREIAERREALESEYRSLLEAKRQELEQHWQKAFAAFDKETRHLLSQVKDKYFGVRARREVERKAIELRRMASESLEKTGIQPGSTPVAESSLVTWLRPGVKVHVKRFGQAGVLIAPHKESLWEVAVGNLKCVMNPAELEPLPGEPLSKDGRQILPSQITVQLSTPELQSNEINLIGCSVDEALRRTDKFLDQAYLASVSTVRLVHGFGMGILRKALSEWLSTQPSVSDFHTAAPNEGGNAVTVVSLKN